MKNYLKVMVAIVFATNLMAQNVPNYVPKNGLVGWWPFNGNANDESGNGNHGTVNGAVLTSDRNGKVNSAYNFDGINNDISISKLNNMQYKPISYSVWFNPDSLNVVTYSKGGGIVLVGRDHCGYYDQGSVMIFDYASAGIDNNIAYYRGQDVSKTYYTPLINKWQNIIASIDENDTIKFYLNGTLISKQYYVIAQNGANIPFKFGAGTCTSSSNRFLFNGQLDDIAIYNRALTHQEITALYTGVPSCTTPTATITPQGNTTFCQGGFVNLNASTGTNYTYEWYNNGQLINGATASVYQASTSSNYTVKVIDGACNTTSTVTTVTVNQYPSSVVNVSGNTTFCEGNSVTLTAQGSGTYLWNNGVTSKSITVSQAGSYGVAVTSNGCVSNSNQTTVTVNPNPTATITPQGNTTFCQGGFVNLVASGGTSYQWNTGSSAPTLSATQSGTYTVNVFNSFGCQATASQQVIVNPLPNVTLNALNQFTLKNASPIQLVANPTGGTFSGDGIQGSTFTPANVSLGKKTITYNYTSPQGCSGKASSNTFVVDSIGNVCSTYDTLKVKFKLTTGIKANQYTTMNVYPNPTSDVIIIDASDVAALNGYSYKLFDAQGKEVYNAFATNTKTEISMKTFGKAGLYILHVVDANNVSIETKQIVLE